MPTFSTNPKLRNSFLTLLVFLKHKAEEKDLEPVISVSKVIDLLRGSGLKLSYQQLVDLTQDPTISPSIKSINKNQLELNLGTEEVNTDTLMNQPKKQSSQPPENQEKFDFDDFSSPEYETSETSEPEELEEPEEKPHQSIISQMAKRAAKRMD